MKKSTDLMLKFLTLPFVVSASMEFLPEWLAIPIAVISGMFWLGVLVQIGEYKKEDEEVKE